MGLLWGNFININYMTGFSNKVCQNGSYVPSPQKRLNLKVLGKDTISFGWDSPLSEVAKHCAYCGIEVLTDQETEKMSKIIPRQKGQELQNSLNFILEKYLSLKRPAPKIPIIRDLIQFSENNPDMSGRDIIKHYKRSKRKVFKAKLSIQQGIVEKYCKELQPIIPQMPGLYQPRLIKIVQNPPHTIKNLANQINVIRFKNNRVKKILPEDFITFSDKVTKSYERYKIQNKADDFLARQLKEPPEELIKKLVEPLKVTLEHIKPHSKNGPNNTTNYLPVCSYCNVKRGNIDFPEWLQEHPEIKGFIKSSLIELKKAIAALSDPPKRLAGYINNVITTLKMESQGKLVINLEDL